MPSFLFSLALLLPAVVNAANDWNAPCLQGSCSFDLHNSTSPHGGAAGSIYIVRFLSHSFRFLVR